MIDTNHVKNFLGRSSQNRRSTRRWAIYTAISVFMAIAFGVMASMLVGKMSRIEGIRPTISSGIDFEPILVAIRLCHFNTARNRLTSLWQRNLKPGERQRTAFYLAICAQQTGSTTANDWFNRCQAGSGILADAEDKAYFVALSDAPSGANFPANQPKDSKPDNLDRLQQVARFAIKARKDFAAKSSIENQIRLASWLVMFGELAVETPRASLWSSAVDAFDEGQQHFAAIEASIDKDPTLERKISTEPAIAMRLDAARVRKDRIEGRIQLARQQERERLRQLRQLATAYRDVANEVAIADADTLLGDWVGLQHAHAQITADLATAEKLIKRRDDFFLLVDEPQATTDADIKAWHVTMEGLADATPNSMKVLDALAEFRLATNVVGQPNAELLRQAEGLLKSSEPTPSERPGEDRGPDVLRLCVTAFVADELGAATVEKNPADRESIAAAKPLFEQARDSGDKVRAKLATIPGGVANPLVRELLARLTRLEAPQDVLAAADREALHGNAMAASNELRDLMLRNPTPEVYLARTKVGVAAGVDPMLLLNELDSAQQAGIFVADDWRLSLAKGRLRLLDAHRRLAGMRATADHAKSVQRSLAQADADLRTAQKKCATDQIARARIQAFLALAIVDRTIGKPNDAKVTADLTEAISLSRDAEATLAAHKKQAPAGALFDDSEALIAERQALGYASVRMLPDYHDEPLWAFAAAIDEASEVPGADHDIRLLGTPMIDALRARSGNRSVERQVAEERSMRQSAMRLAEGAVALQYGAPTAAAAQLDTAERILVSGADNGAAQPGAAELLSQSDGYDAQTRLLELARGLSILGKTLGSTGRVALAGGLADLLPNSIAGDPNQLDRVNNETLAQVPEKVQSPVLGFAIGEAAEAYVESLPVNAAESQRRWLRFATEMRERTAQLLQSGYEHERYPHLAAINDAALARLKSPQPWLDSALQFRARGDLDGSIRELERAVTRHPDAKAVWQALFKAYSDRMAHGSSSPQHFAALDQRLHAGHAAGMVSDHQFYLLLGELNEEQELWEKALAAYEAAAATATAASERVVAISKTSMVRTRLAESEVKLGLR